MAHRIHELSNVYPRSSIIACRIRSTLRSEIGGIGLDDAEPLGLISLSAFEGDLDVRRMRSASSQAFSDGAYLPSGDNRRTNSPKKIFIGNLDLQRSST
jgi:hypothetical protein